MPERMTLEHMALSVVVTIEKTGRAFKDLIPAGLSLEEITVMAAPRFESRWTPWTNGDQRGLSLPKIWHIFHQRARHHHLLPFFPTTLQKKTRLAFGNRNS